MNVSNNGINVYLTTTITYLPFMLLSCCRGRWLLMQSLSKRWKVSHRWSQHKFLYVFVSTGLWRTILRKQYVVEAITYIPIDCHSILEILNDRKKYIISNEHCKFQAISWGDFTPAPPWRPNGTQLRTPKTNEKKNIHKMYIPDTWFSK